MSDTATTIPPALSPSEWAEHRDYSRAHDPTLPILGRPAPDVLHSEVAIANFAIPDGDPRKLTDEDRAVCYLVADVLRNRGEGDYALGVLETLGAKLAALLPPSE